MILLDILRIIITVAIAIYVGKCLAKIKMPAILGWLITGMILGPHAIGILSESITSQHWYELTLNVLEATVGIMIGTELVWSKMKRLGKQIFIITLTQSLGTFVVVSAVFAGIFIMVDIPVYLALIFGGIALATAPAPALSIVNEYKTDGPVTNTLIPMAALDDVIGVVVFLSVMAFVSKISSEQGLPLYMILLIIGLPLIIGVLVGVIAGKSLKVGMSKKKINLLIGLFILIASSITMVFNYIILPMPMLNFMLVGMALSATFANMIEEEHLEEVVDGFKPIIGFALIIMILNLGAPLNYKLILGAGLYTAVYILSRAVGKIGGAYVGAKITKAPKTVEKYLGFTLLPHSGVSLVFTGIAASVLSKAHPDYAGIIQGTIAAAAVINEVIAVLLSKQAFKKSGEFYKKA